MTLIGDWMMEDDGGLNPEFEALNQNQFQKPLEKWSLQHFAMDPFWGMKVSFGPSSDRDWGLDDG